MLYMLNITVLSPAVPGEDYQEVTQELVFGPNSTTICTFVAVFDDESLESAETFTVSLTTAVEDSAVVSLSVHEVTVQILEDPTDGNQVVDR